LIPVDSEHSAIFQIIKDRNTNDVSKMILTASGGAVYDKTLEELVAVTADECMSHPTWDMGYKITIDSATLFNKGIEIIEASNLFGIDYSKLAVYIHPQSIVHGMVEYIDGTLIACMATQDMKIPIQYALTYPAREKCPADVLSIDKISNMQFGLPDYKRFPCLRIAIEAGKAGGSAPVVLCAADEAAVDSFREGRIGFMDIPAVIEKVLDKEIAGTRESSEEIEHLYYEAKITANKIIEDLNK
jgi:1-deoxy-D-xylulose-5-phosphate reductoisomerase